MPGWLGSGSPESFIDCIQRDEPLPCHQTLDYEDEDWLAKWVAQQNGSMCAGALIFMANKLQRPHTPGFPTMAKDHETVFSNTIEFVRHHREAATHSWDDADQNDGAKFQRNLIEQSAKSMGQPIVDRANALPKKKRSARSTKR